jgi:hypothetical protein
MWAEKKAVQMAVQLVARTDDSTAAQMADCSVGSSAGNLAASMAEKRAEQMDLKKVEHLAGCLAGKMAVNLVA